MGCAGPVCIGRIKVQAGCGRSRGHRDPICKGYVGIGFKCHNLGSCAVQHKIFKADHFCKIRIGNRHGCSKHQGAAVIAVSIKAERINPVATIDSQISRQILGGRRNYRICGGICFAPVYRCRNHLIRSGIDNHVRANARNSRVCAAYAKNDIIARRAHDGVARVTAEHIKTFGLVGQA